MKAKHKISIINAILAAALYAISTPFSKLLLNEIPPTMLAALLYLGAGIGMTFIFYYQKVTGKIKDEMKLTKKEMPYTVSMVILDIIAPIFLMVGLTMTTPATVSLLNNFEIVATSFIALLIFKENINKKLWIGIAFITFASIILSFNDINSLSLSFGSLFIILACISWGIENNCTRMLSVKDPLQIVIIKGFGSGLGSLIISFIINEIKFNLIYIISALLLGFVSYGLSIYLYVLAQRYLGAAKTSAYYAISPFIGALLSLIIFLELPTMQFIAALLIMLIGTYFASTDNT